MDIMSQFAERLKELMFDAGLSAEQLGMQINHNVYDIIHWKSGKNKNMPSVANLVKLASFFNCSVDYLLGFVDDYLLVEPKNQLAFGERFRLVVEQKGFSLYSLSKAINMGTKQFYKWINGQTQPSIDSLIRIASILDCSIDYLLGRE